MESFVLKFSQFSPYTVLKRVSGCNRQIWCPSVSLSFWTLLYLLLLCNEDANTVVKVAAAAPYDAPLLLLLVLHFPEKEFRLFTALFRRRCTLPLSSLGDSSNRMEEKGMMQFWLTACGGPFLSSFFLSFFLPAAKPRSLGEVNYRNNKSPSQGPNRCFKHGFQMSCQDEGNWDHHIWHQNIVVGI